MVKKKIDKIKNGLPFKSDRIHKLSLFFLCFFLGVCNKFLQRYTQNLLTVHALPRAAITRSFPELAGALVILFDARADRMLNFCLAFVSLNFHQKKVSAEPVGGAEILLECDLGIVIFRNVSTECYLANKDRASRTHIQSFFMKYEILARAWLSFSFCFSEVAFFFFLCVCYWKFPEKHIYRETGHLSIPVHINQIKTQPKNHDVFLEL